MCKLGRGNAMDGSRLVRWLGFPATLIFGDTLVLDRWLWLRKRLPAATSGERLLDPILRRFLGCRDFSICLVAYQPRFST